MKAPTYRELRALSTEELIERYDAATTNVEVGVAFLRDEIARRDVEASTAEVVRMTRTMRNLTWWIAFLTLVNAILVVLSLLLR